MDQHVSFYAEDITLEGHFSMHAPDRGVVVTHPHPLYGGDMHNSVVDTMAKVYGELGWSTLRFNFRGVGASQGSYDQGQGEQYDLQAAIDFLSTKGIQKIDLAGYSFGAWVISRWSQRNPASGHRIILVSPPVAFIDFEDIGPIAGLAGVISGESDDIAPPDKITAMLPRWQPGIELCVLQHTDHFYAGGLNALGQSLADIISSIK
jgi:alpha/beta superfamily hydrolase